MFKKRDRNEVRVIRHARVRKKISGTPEMPRLCVYRSNKSIYAQVIDDTKGITLVSASTLDAALRGQLEEVDKSGAAKLVGKLVAERALNAGIKDVVFDRGGYVYTGRVAAVAAGAREAGLNF
ncbi:MAG: 50S ribosomal protein L18 [Clostridiales bacterium]|nr:50S ribosomal protein L18 [Clostridiales bacterium]